MYKKVLQKAVACGIPQERIDKIWSDTLSSYADLLEMGMISEQELDEKFRKRLVLEFPEFKQQDK